MATSSTTERRFAAEAWGMRTEALGSAKEAHRRWPEGRSEQGASKANDAPPGCTGRAAARDGNRSARVLHGERVGQGESLGSWAMDLCVAVPIGLELF